LLAAGWVLLHTSSSNEVGGEASPQKVEVARQQPTPLVPVEQAADDQRIDAAAADAPWPAPAESVKAKLERLMLEQPLTPADVPVSDLEGEIQRIERLIYEATREEFEYRFARRIGVQTLSTDPDSKYDAKGHDPLDVYWVRFTPGGPTEKVTLPKDEFPEVYELKAKSALYRSMLDHPGLIDAEPDEPR
jgi:hypothetical protein